jgi:hypothetical protein
MGSTDPAWPSFAQSDISGPGTENYGDISIHPHRKVIIEKFPCIYKVETFFVPLPSVDGKIN